jgi:Nucleotidyl transferase AbiEii toxin, Type IV TA system
VHRRTRPRDLYDVVNLDRNSDARPEQQQFIEVLREKCAFKGIELPRLAEIEPYRSALEAGWVHMLDHQLPALLPVNAFWDALPEIFDWLHGRAETPDLAPMSLRANDALIRERIIGLPAGSRGQSFIETIRFAAANRLLVEIDYRDKKGVRSMRSIEAYSLRRSQAGDVLLMAVRADSGQPRSYLVSSILGVSPTQISFSPRFPIELTPSGAQSIPATSRSAGIQSVRSSTHRTSRIRATSTGPKYVYRCTVCRKLFERKTQDSRPLATLPRRQSAKASSRSKN